MTKDECRRKTAAAIKHGELAKTPCQVCGDVNVQVHHLDYSDPLNVAFLCKKHHYELHRDARSGRAGFLKDPSSISVNMSKEMLTNLDRMAKGDGNLSRAQFIRILIHQEIARRNGKVQL